ncbi:hypothetical protein DQ04_00741040 [Trypanosoma grayi]|uniref:hypothetical protein n=1 Tax=Trypanosoma grayi TaxID=71804 RepID=UPI0004F4B439|nr:hypothetical protein DQ04_00741040 [Trypanosoma grayi]KEG13860.1 hypothetical protein DQ04_00741040 [Trypanosoma grayi]
MALPPWNEPSPTLSETYIAVSSSANILEGRLWWIMLASIAGVALLVLLVVSVCVYCNTRRKMRSLEQLELRQQRRVERDVRRASLVLQGHHVHTDVECNEDEDEAYNLPVSPAFSMELSEEYAYDCDVDVRE